MYAVDPETSSALTSPSGTQVSTGDVTGPASAAAAAVSETSATAIVRRATTVRASPRRIGPTVRRGPPDYIGQLAYCSRGGRRPAAVAASCERLRTPSLA